MKLSSITVLWLIRFINFISFWLAAENFEANIEYSNQCHHRRANKSDDFEGSERILKVGDHAKGHNTCINIEYSSSEIVVEETHISYNKTYPALDSQNN